MDKMYYVTDKGMNYDVLFMALRHASEEEFRMAEAAGSTGRPFKYNPTFDEVWRYVPSGIIYKADAARLFAQMVAAGLVARAPYRGYSPYLVPEAGFRDEWNRRFGAAGR